MTSHRGLVIGAGDFGPYWTNLAAKAGLTTLGLHPVPGVPAHDSRSFECLLSSLKTPTFLRDVRELQSQGIGLTLEAHVLAWLLPRNLFDTHPDWFRLDEEGKRTPDLNLCPSSEAALNVVETRAAEVADRIAGVFQGHRYHLWMDDNSRRCHCDRCHELSASDQALVTYHRILQGVRRVDPLGTVAYLAYQNTLRAPSQVIPQPGIFVEFAPVDRDSRFPLASSKISRNVTAGSFVPDLFACFGAAGSQVLEYWMDNSYFYRWTPPYGELPFYRGVLRRDVRHYRSLGFQHFTAFACGLNPRYEEEFGPPPVEEYGKILQEEGR